MRRSNDDTPVPGHAPQCDDVCDVLRHTRIAHPPSVGARACIGVGVCAGIDVCFRIRCRTSTGTGTDALVIIHDLLLADERERAGTERDEAPVIFARARRVDMCVPRRGKHGEEFLCAVDFLISMYASVHDMIMNKKKGTDLEAADVGVHGEDLAVEHVFALCGL